jgi:site-specific recombinase XerD
VTERDRVLVRKREERARVVERPAESRLARYWRKADLAKAIVNLVHYQGKAIKTKLRRSWDSVRREARHERKDSAHILRRSCATMLMQAGVDNFEAAGYLGMQNRRCATSTVITIPISSPKPLTGFRANRTGTR